MFDFRNTRRDGLGNFHRNVIASMITNNRREESAEAPLVFGFGDRPAGKRSLASMLRWEAAHSAQTALGSKWIGLHAPSTLIEAAWRSTALETSTDSLGLSADEQPRDRMIYRRNRGGSGLIQNRIFVTQLTLKQWSLS